MTDQSDLFGAPKPAAAPTPEEPPATPRAIRDPNRYPIPALNELVRDAQGVHATRKSRCNGSTCGAVIYWVHGRRFPIAVNFVGCNAPTNTEPGLGVSHYINCPNASEFSKSARGDL